MKGLVGAALLLLGPAKAGHYLSVSGPPRILFGPYTVDAAKKIVVHHVAGSSLPNWLGSEQVRHYGFSADGRQLTLSLKPGDRITQTLTWERSP